jgi:hypothetical protein
MTTSPIAAAAGTARQRLASSLASLQQDPNLPAAILDVVSGLARAMGPLFQVERGLGDPSLLYSARTVLQETLARMQQVDQSYPGVADATAAIAQSLGTIFATIRDHRIEEAVSVPAPSLVSVPPSAPPAAPPVAAPPVAAPPVAAPPAAPPVAAPPAAPPVAAPPAAPVPLVQPVAAPVPLVQPAAAPVPLVQPAAPVLLVPAVPAAGATMERETTASAPVRAPVVPSLLPDTAAKVPMGPNGVPRLEAELDVHSESNFYTNFLGDIRDHGGIFVATFAVLNVNTACEVLISFPGSLTAEVRGVVKWRRVNTDNGQVPGLGIEITHGSPEAWKLIDRFIKNREPIIHDV